MFKKILSLILMLTLVISFTACKKDVADVEETESLESDVTQSVGEEEITVNNKADIVLNLWYTDTHMQGYFEESARRYMQENPKVAINVSVAAANNYLENINTQSIKQTNAVDIYMLDTMDLEKAYLAGLALEYDPTNTVYTPQNYGQAALNAVTYDGKTVAYPLYFDSVFMLYNPNYVTTVPTNFEELLDFSNNIEYSEGGGITDNIEKTFIWPVSDYMFNYGFLSDAFNVGGKCGDNRADINVSNETVASSLEFYKSLQEFFAIDRNEVDYEYCLNSFIEGKNAFIFAKTDAITKLFEAGMGYGTASIPDISSTVAASSLSFTQALVINPYSTYYEEAKDFVQALTYDYVDDMYWRTSYFPSYNNWSYDKNMFGGIYDNYASSMPTPKFMTIGNYYIELEILLHKVWDKDKEVTELLDEFQNFLITQIN